jgi:Ca2+-dependent lipid-binding protein
MITLSEKPTLEFDVDLPLGLEGTVSNAIQEWLETLVENILETTLVWPERLVVPIADPEMPVTLPDGSTRTHEWYVENVLKLRDVGLVCLRVVRAENVVGTDILSKADARVRAKVKGLTWSATDAVNNSNDPVFGQTLYMLVDDPNERSLTVQVQDADDAEQGGFGRDTLIAETKVSLSEFARAPHARNERWIEFPQTAARNAAKKSRPPMRVLCEVTYVPFDLEGSTTDSSEAAVGLVGVGMLTARVLRGVGLKGADNGGKSSDPFCKLAMRKANVDGASSASSKKDLIRHKTRTCEQTLDPEWNERFEFVGVREDAALVVDVYDRDKGYVIGSSKESLGSFEVQPARDVVAHRASQSGGAKHTRAHKMEKTTVTRTFSLKGDASVRGGIEMELTWQPFAAE